MMTPYSIQVRGRLIDLSLPRVMGILNATPDSFYAASRSESEGEIARRAVEIVEQGGDMIDVGAYSTRPGCSDVPEEEEMRRLRMALATVRREVPEAIVSVDTFRPAVALRAVEDWGADIINDVGAPASSPAAVQRSMAEVVAALRCPYVMMSAEATMHDMLLSLSARVRHLRSLGVSDIIVDPGFGFGKTVADNYRVLARLDRLQALRLPVLAGLSRKSMVWRVAGGDASTALAGTVSLQTEALDRGASILRVHDVREAVEQVRVWTFLKQNSI